MNKFNATEYKNDYTREKYDRINFTAPKGYKEKLETRAEKLGYKNVGSYLKALVEKDMGGGQK